MLKIFPKKLESGDTIRVLSPSTSLKLIDDSVRKIANARFQNMGLMVSFADNSDVCDLNYLSTVRSRVDDIHQAFADTQVKAIFTAIGGYDANSILQSLDYSLIRDNPKILCGYSDITSIANAIFNKAGLVTYIGPHYSTFGMVDGFDFCERYIKKCLFSTDPFEINESETWSNDAWYLDQKNREYSKNTGIEIISKHSSIKVSGTIIGGNISAFTSLFGTTYRPSLERKILFLEYCTDGRSPHELRRNLASLIQQEDFERLKAIVFGRFQPNQNITGSGLYEIFLDFGACRSLPIIAGVDFGHTFPMITFPIGGEATIEIVDVQSKPKINIIKN